MCTQLNSNAHFMHSQILKFSSHDYRSSVLKLARFFIVLESKLHSVLKKNDYPNPISKISSSKSVI